MLFMDSIPEAVYELLFPRELEKKKSDLKNKI